MIVNDEKVFSVPEHYFSISGSDTGYTLMYGNDGSSWAEWEEEIPAGEPVFIANAPMFAKYYLKGNVGTVEVRW